MANVNFFRSLKGKLVSETNTFNDAGAKAYTLSPEQVLAQFATTGCFNSTFYSDEKKQLQSTLELCEKVSPMFLAKLAIYSRENGHMKDFPALLVAKLSISDKILFQIVFERIIKDGKMIRNFTQIMRSGILGRKSLGSLPKRMIKNWFANTSADKLFLNSAGNNPSLSDLIKMVHPKSTSNEKDSLYNYLIGHKSKAEFLSPLVKEFEAFKTDRTLAVPNVPFELLTSLDLDKRSWKEIAKNASWTMTRMNLNTFQRHGVFEEEELTILISDRLKNEDLIKKSKVFPYQIMTTYLNVNSQIPKVVLDSLNVAMEVSIFNVPKIDGKIYIMLDVSGSMNSAITGNRKGSTSKIRCIDVAALFAVAITRKNLDSIIIPFDTKSYNIEFNKEETILSKAKKLASYGGGGTNCSLPLAMLNKKKSKADLIIYLSDNESWADPKNSMGTELMNEWNRFKGNNPKAKMICIDIQPNATSQAENTVDVLNIGGFSDEVFELIKIISTGEMNPDNWVKKINSIKIK